MVSAMDLMRASRSASAGPDMADVTEAAGDGGESGAAGDGVDAVGFSGGVDDEDRLEHDTRLSRVSGLRVAGPRLRNS